MPDRKAVGHRALPHTADLRIEAWAPGPEQCLVEAVAGTVGSFADVAGAQPTDTVTMDVDHDPDHDPRRGIDADVLVAVLEEVIYLLDTRGLVPVHTEVAAAGNRLTVRFSMTDAELVPQIGAVPKAVSLHDLRWEQRADGWWCAVTLDV
jgi:SHS2 domain-containing protein